MPKGEGMYKEAFHKVVRVLAGYEVFTFPWGAAVKSRRTGNWTSVHYPDGQELNIENWEVILHENGIEILSIKKRG